MEVLAITESGNAREISQREREHKQGLMRDVVGRSRFWRLECGD